ncbi:MAG: hypothetical protein NXY57DRAFT_969681 [Lentinula lateritia]|nr:MAG: hypothetical protein NXY57DRAFT_969681 [Lentinula lateritia]
MNQALKLLNSLPKKWDPRSELPEDYQNKPIPTSTLPSGENPFDTNITTTGSLANIFRIFTDETIELINILPKLKPQPRIGEQRITIATDGSCENNDKQNAKAGAGVFIADKHAENRSAKLPQYVHQSNQTGEIVAVKIAAEVINSETAMTIETDSKYVLELLRNPHKLEDKGFIDTSNAKLIQSTIASLRLRPTQTLLK